MCLTSSDVHHIVQMINLRGNEGVPSYLNLLLMSLLGNGKLY